MSTNSKQTQRKHEVEFPSEREGFLNRLQKKGPVPRSVFDRSTDLAADLLLEAAVATAVNKDNYSSWVVNHDVQLGDTIVHRVFLVLPRETVDEATGAVIFLRECCETTFLSNHVTHLAAVMVQKSREVYARAEIDGNDVQDVFGVRAVFAAVMLAGDAEDFVVEAGKVEETSARPLYLRPFLTTFAAVDSIFITDRAVYLIQCTIAGSHTFVVRTVLQILDRLQAKLKFNLRNLNFYYCVVGSASKLVNEIVNAATRKLDVLKEAVNQAHAVKQARGPKRPRTTTREPPAHPELTELSLRAVGRLHKLVARGVVFDPVKNTLSLAQ
ncbi:hypothetical protein B0H12DRAFT_1236460 [Mycena haematopus]|nr:hypothetical protein B0H12DRAFT_1236460 [Mycena haematopus]